MKVENDVTSLVLDIWQYEVEVYNFTKTDLFDEPVENITDYKLIVEGQTLYVCKKILATYSSFFYEILYEMATKTLTEYELEFGLSCNMFRVFLGLLYNRNNFLTGNNVRNVASTSKSFAVKNCLEECEKWVIESDWHPVTKLGMAKMFDFKVLPHHVLSNIQTIDDIMEMDRWVDFANFTSDLKIALFDRLTEIKRGEASNPENGQFEKQKIAFTEKRENLTDVALFVDGRMFYVSKQLLACRSSVFYAMFFGNFDEKRKEEIELKEIKADDFDIFLQLVHFPNLNLDKEIIEPVLKLSQMFDIEILTKNCETFLRIEKDMNDVRKIELAEKYSLPQLFDDISSKIKTQKQYKKLSKMEGFERLSMETLGKISMNLLQ